MVRARVTPLNTAVERAAKAVGKDNFGMGEEDLAYDVRCFGLATFADSSHFFSKLSVCALSRII